MTRTEGLAKVRAAVAAEFPKALIRTNEDQNPATPMCVTVTWGGRISKAVRAQNIQVDPDAFAQAAVETLRNFYKSRVAGSAYAL
jgi:hypothetical protein